MKSWYGFEEIAPHDLLSIVRGDNYPSKSSIHHLYRLVRKYMPQPGLMKMRRTFIDKTCLSSDGASVSFADLLNSGTEA
jgi:hypothetical protein